MKRSVALFAFAGLSLLAACGSTSSSTNTSHAVNTTCPVSGKAVDPAIPMTEFRGQMVGFCCAKCPPKWVAMSESDRQAKLTAAMPQK